MLGFVGVRVERYPQRYPQLVLMGADICRFLLTVTMGVVELGKNVQV
jgi:hypothetical protein